MTDSVFLSDTPDPMAFLSPAMLLFIVLIVFLLVYSLTIDGEVMGLGFIFVEFVFGLVSFPKVVPFESLVFSGSLVFSFDLLTVGLLVGCVFSGSLVFSFDLLTVGLLLFTFEVKGIDSLLF